MGDFLLAARSGGWHKKEPCTWLCGVLSFSDILFFFYSFSRAMAERTFAMLSTKESIFFSMMPE